MYRLLVIGRNPHIMQRVLGLLQQQAAWSVQGSLTDGDALAFFRQNHYHLVVIGGGVEEHSAQMLEREFRILKPEIKVVRHFGGDQNGLINNIKHVLEHEIKRIT